MGLLTVVFAFATGLAARVKPDREAELEGQIAKLEEDLAEARLNSLRWMGLAEAWQGRWEQTQRIYDANPLHAYYPGGHPAQQLNPNQQAMYQAMMGQKQAQAQPYNQGLGFGELVDSVIFCNCVPSRSQVWRERRGPLGLD